MTTRYDFASDNTAGICPEAFQSILTADSGPPAPSYGNDFWTQQASDAIRRLFDCECEVFFVFNGTAANSLALASLCQSYHSVICHELAHVETDECGAPEFFSNGTKLLLAGGENGKLNPAEVERLVTRRKDIHYPKPKTVSLTQSSECGTVYSLAELRRLRDCARELGLKIHLDGARFANACASLKESPAQMIQAAGADVLSLGGCKMGRPLGEAVVFFQPELAVDFAWRCKQAGQLASKMRYLAAPWVGMLRDGVWLRHAGHANQMARRLSQELCRLPGVSLIYPVESNAVFVQVPQYALDELRKAGWAFYQFIGSGGARFVCSWSTSADVILELASTLAEILGATVGSGRPTHRF